jgi:hypothetical protein
MLGREVERDQPFHLRGAGQLAGLPRRQMVLLGRPPHLLVREGRLDEQCVRAAGEIDDGGDVRRRISGVGHVGDLLARYDPQHLVPELAEGNRALAERPVLTPAHRHRRF